LTPSPGSACGAAVRCDANPDAKTSHGQSLMVGVVVEFCEAKREGRATFDFM
jgi:hypothetical protein